MAANFFIRTIKKNGDATLFVRVRIVEKGIDIKQSTGLVVNAAEWTKAQNDAKVLKKYRISEKPMFDKLDSIVAMVDTLVKENVEITADMLKERIHTIINAEQIAAEKQRQEEEAKAEEEKNRITFNDFVAQYIEECATGDRKKKDSTLNVATGTVKSFRGFFAQLKAYQEDRHIIIDFPDITVAFYEDFKRFMLDKQYSPNTIARITKILKMMCYAAERVKLFDAKDIRTSVLAHPKDVDNVYLSDERIQELYDLDLSRHEAWEKVRDVFVIGCLTGQRVSDYKRINKSMIVELSDGNKYIKLKQEKTRKMVFIPLDYRVEAILAKYNGVLPKLFDQKINDYIKKVGEMLGWTEIVEMDEQRGSMEYVAKRRFCDLIKTHTARRSFATNMYRAGASLSSIMAITGHGSEEQLRVYLKLTDEEKAIEARKEMYFRSNNMRIAQ